MASARGIRAGAAYIELFVNDSKLVRGLQRAQKKLKAFGNSVRDFGLKLAGAVSAVTAPLGALTIKSAADAQESLSRFEQVFKDQAKAAGEFADALAKSVGRSRYEVRDALATFQSFFVGMGYGLDQSRQISQQVQQLALDFASFNNISDDEAIERFISALSGSSEVLDRFGINIKQAALQQELLRMGIGKSWTEVTEQEKALARLNIIMRSMGDQGAVGDAVRTAGSFTNQMKRLRGEVRDASVEIGRALLPVVTPLVAKVAQAMRWFGAWISQNQQLVVTLFKVAAAVIAAGAGLMVLGTALSSVGAILGTLASVLTGVGTAMGVMGSIITAMISPIGLTVAAIAALGAYLIYVSGAGGQALSWLGDRFADLSDFASESFQGISDALMAGDIALAAKVLWLSLKVLWQKGALELARLWEGLSNSAMKTVSGMWYGLQAAWEIGTASVTKVMLKLYYGVLDVWQRLSMGVMNVWDSAINWVAKRIVDLWGLVDDTLDTDAVKQGLDSDAQRRLGERNKEKDQDVQRISQERDEALKQLQQEHERNLARIGQASIDAESQLDAEAQKKIDTAQAEFEAARKEWKEAIGEAREKRQMKQAGGPEQLQSPPNLDDYLKGLGPTIQQAKQKTIAVSGTFNAMESRGLAGGPVADRIAKATEETAKNTKKLLNKPDAQAATFD